MEKSLYKFLSFDIHNVTMYVNIFSSIFLSETVILSVCFHLKKQPEKNSGLNGT